MAEQVAGQGRRGAGAGISVGNSETNGSNPAEQQDDISRLLEAHARHVATQLPRGQLGTRAAEQFLAALPGAVQLRLADITGTAATLVETLVAHGLIPLLPDPKVSRAIPRLLAPLTPLVEARSARLWTLWLTALQDLRSPLVSRLRKATPAAAFAVRSPAPVARVQTQRELVAERDALAAQVVALQAEQAKIAAQLAARTEEHARAVAERDVLAALVAELQTERAARTDTSELERVAEFYEQQLREAEARSSTDFADLQAFLRESVRGQELLTLFTLRKNARPTKNRP